MSIKKSCYLIAAFAATRAFASPSEEELFNSLLQQSSAIAIATVTRADSALNSKDLIETTYKLLVETQLKGSGPDSIRLPGGTIGQISHAVSHVPILTHSQRYAFIESNSGLLDGLSGRRFAILPLTEHINRNGDALSQIYLSAREWLVDHPTWPLIFPAATLPHDMNAWSMFIGYSGPPYSYASSAYLEMLANEWNSHAVFYDLLRVRQLSNDEVIRWNNGRSEYWGKRTLSEINQYFGYDASQACGVTFLSYTGGGSYESDVVIVEQDNDVCNNQRVVLHELGHALNIAHPFEHLDVFFHPSWTTTGALCIRQWQTSACFAHTTHP